MMLRPDRPFTARLPSGVRVTVTGRRIAPAPASLPAALAAGVVDADVDLKALPLADAHVVEGLLVAAGVVEPPPLRCPCHNCGKDLVLEARPFLPVAPLLDPPSDEELDHVPLGEQEHVLAHPVTLRGNDITTFRLAPRTLADRARLEALLGNDPSVPLRVDGPLVRALGLVALGPRTSPIAIARVLQALDDDAFADVWDAIADAYEDQHWPPRLLVAVPCPHCGARHDVEAAGPRLFGLASPRPPTEPFPSLATFRARAEAIVEELFAREDPAVLERLAVVVQDGVPPCDDGGEPLLGSYTPTPEADGDARGTPAPFLIEVFFRTFRSMWAKGAYDWVEELRETLAHELEHHHNFLRGHDPLDEAERAEIEREARRRLGAPRATAVVGRGALWLAADFVAFVRAVWPLLAVGAVVAILLVTCGR